MFEKITNPRPEIVTVRALIIHGDKFLALRRTEGHNFNNGKFELPGGKIDQYESVRDGLVREIKEETGMSILIEDGQLNYLGKRDINDGKHSGKALKVYGILVRVDQQPIIELSHEHDQIVWINLDEVDQYVLTGDSITCINEFKANLL